MLTATQRLEKTNEVLDYGKQTLIQTEVGLIPGLLHGQASPLLEPSQATHALCTW